MTTKPKQINVRTDDELLAAIGEVQVALADPIAPAVSDVIRAGIFALRDQLRADAKRGKRAA